MTDHTPYMPTPGDPLSPASAAFQPHVPLTELQLAVERLRGEVGKVIVGQPTWSSASSSACSPGGTCCSRACRGLAKTLTVAPSATCIQAKFARIQFTPDLLPADLIGTVIYNQQNGDLLPQEGPIFANLVLADEINRAPAKVQSALLEAMQERQVTIGDRPYPLPEPFIVMATQNPIEQEGTYPLPEAQVDRFMLKICGPCAHYFSASTSINAFTSSLRSGGS
jgi:MoxR-like ATPase